MQNRHGIAAALIAAMLAACATAPSPSPSPASPEPTPGADATGAAQPTPTPVGSTDGATFTTIVTAPQGKNPLPVVLLDATGLVTALQSAEPAAPPGEGIHLADGGTTIRYEWVGGACDERAELKLERVGDAIRLSAKTIDTGQACILIGIYRHVLIRLRLPIEEGQLQLLQEQ